MFTRTTLLSCSLRPVLLVIVAVQTNPGRWLVARSQSSDVTDRESCPNKTKTTDKAKKSCNCLH